MITDQPGSRLKIEREIVLSADFMPVLTSYFRMPEINMSGKEHSNLNFNSIRKNRTRSQFELNRNR